MVFSFETSSNYFPRFRIILVVRRVSVHQPRHPPAVGPHSHDHVITQRHRCQVNSYVASFNHNDVTVAREILAAPFDVIARHQKGHVAESRLHVRHRFLNVGQRSRHVSHSIFGFCRHVCTPNMDRYDGFRFIRNILLKLLIGHFSNANFKREFFSDQILNVFEVLPALQIFRQRNVTFGQFIHPAVVTGVTFFRQLYKFRFRSVVTFDKRKIEIFEQRR